MTKTDWIVVSALMASLVVTASGSIVIGYHVGKYKADSWYAVNQRVPEAVSISYGDYPTVPCPNSPIKTTQLTADNSFVSMSGPLEFCTLLHVERRDGAWCSDNGLDWWPARFNNKLLTMCYMEDKR